MNLLFGGAKNESDCFSEPFPIDYFGFQVFPVLSGERVELRIPPGFSSFPFGFEPAAIFKSVKRGVERPLMDLKEVFRYLLQALRDRVAVVRPRATIFKMSKSRVPLMYSAFPWVITTPSVSTYSAKKQNCQAVTAV